jgi:hypothetical protein
LRVSSCYVLFFASLRFAGAEQRTRSPPSGQAIAKRRCNGRFYQRRFVPETVAERSKRSVFKEIQCADGEVGSMNTECSPQVGRRVPPRVEPTPAQMKLAPMTDRLGTSAAVLILVGLAALATLWPDGPGQEMFIGLLLGTLFGHTTVAAAWCAYGPGPLIIRMPASLAWIVTLLFALAIAAGLHNRPSDFLPGLGLCLLGQWLLLQLLFWGLHMVLGIQLTSFAGHMPATTASHRQFGIGQLMIATAVVGVALGLGRWTVAVLPPHFGSSEFMIFGFLALAAVLMGLPLSIAALLPRYWIVAVMAIAVLIAGGTVWELPLLEQVRRGGGPGFADFAWINGFTAAWILAFAVSARFSNFTLTRSFQPTPQAALAQHADPPS